MAEKEHISYEEINAACKKLAYLLNGKGFTRIVAVARGGLVPACIVAQFLDIRQISSIALVGYDGEKQTEKLQCLVCPDIPIDQQTLFVDDLYDSGNTYRYLKQQYPAAKIAVLFNKNPDAVLDFPAIPKEAEKWLVFPWEFEPLNQHQKQPSD